MKKIFFIPVISFFIFSCSSTKSFDREHELNVFLKENDIDTAKTEKKYVVIIQSNPCNSCFLQLFDNVKKYLEKEYVEKDIIFSTNNQEIIQDAKLLNNATVMYDSLHRLAPLGLAFSNLVIKYNKGKIINWAEISYDNLKYIRKMIR
ncbi:MAG: hypothetical protein JSU03_12700 [Bacteroidetes bacterium]|nr:hypothetical protein [Bacteroidota bacterium]MBS1758125.1 hypothetical protein [Bacteroidota bacterium]